jgi:hypothetical protein
MQLRSPVGLLLRLGDGAPDEHFIVFYKGKMVDIICPHGKTKKASRK